MGISIHPRISGDLLCFKDSTHTVTTASWAIINQVKRYTSFGMWPTTLSGSGTDARFQAAIAYRSYRLLLSWHASRTSCGFGVHTLWYTWYPQRPHKNWSMRLGVGGGWRMDESWLDESWLVRPLRQGFPCLHHYLQKPGPIMIFILQSLFTVSMDNNNNKDEYD